MRYTDEDAGGLIALPKPDPVSGPRRPVGHLAGEIA